jgi:hypothetical protein
MAYVKLASQKSSNPKRAAELASRSVISSSSSSSKKKSSTSSKITADESPAEYAIKAGIPAADLARAGISNDVVQQVAAAQGTTVPTTYAYGSESPLAASKKATATPSTSTASTVATTGSAGKEYVFVFSGPLKGSIATYVNKLVKLLGGKRAYIEEESKLVVVM